MIVTLPDLRLHCALACDCADDGHRRQMANIVCDLAVQWSARFKPRSHRAYERMQRRIAKKAHDQAVGMGLAAVIGVAALSWLVQKLLDVFWHWWRGEPQAETLVCGMAVGLPAWSDNSNDDL